jgi:hypothetical protein
MITEYWLSSGFERLSRRRQPSVKYLRNNTKNFIEKSKMIDYVIKCNNHNLNNSTPWSGTIKNSAMLKPIL